MRRKQALPRICVAATGRTTGELMECARRALEQSRFVELRLDWVANPADAIAAIPKLLADAAHATGARKPILQATCRRRSNGGRFTGSLARQFELLHIAAAAGCAVADLEIESAERAGPEAVASLREAARLILSFHDFNSTPPLAPVARRLRRYAADYYKIVPTATRQSDNCAVLEFLASVDKDGSEAEKWIAFAMGEPGVPSRVLALSRGSAFVYAAPGITSAADSEAMLAAPSQLDWNTLHRQYRAERLTEHTAIYGLLGNPVRHSVGPAIHNRAFRARRLDAVYLPLLATDLSELRKAATRYPLAGFSVTIPHKQAILRFADKIDRWAKAAGAANTVRVSWSSGRGRWEAINADIDGIRIPLQKAYSLSEGRLLPKGFRAVIVGSGGAARAAFIALRTLGCRSPFVAGRSPARTRRFVQELGGEALTLDSLKQGRFDLLIHATPVGMWPHAEECLLAEQQLCAETVFDLVYNPPETRLLRMARALGCRTISGLEMFMAQAARQFEFWTGVDAPVIAMRQAALEALERFPAMLEDAAARRP